MFTWKIMSSLFNNPSHVLIVYDPVVVMKEIMARLLKDPLVIMKEVMPWLIKDPLYSGLAQFEHAQSNIKK